jgi:hypothetical protein
MAEDKTGVYMLGVVGIVAAVAILVGMMNLGVSGDTNLSGAAVSAGDRSTSPTYTDWTSCLDHGSQIKLANDEGSSLVKRDLCTGSTIAGKQIKTVSCVQAVDGGYTYKFANPQDCAEGLRCMKDDNNAAYCG